MLLFPIDVPQLEKWVSFVKGLPQDLKILFRVANAHANDLNASASPTFEPLGRSKARSAVFRSGGEIGHQLYKEFGAGKLDCVDFQSVPTDEAQGAGYGFWRVDGARGTRGKQQGPRTQDGCTKER